MEPVAGTDLARFMHRIHARIVAVTDGNTRPRFGPQAVRVSDHSRQRERSVRKVDFELMSAKHSGSDQDFGRGCEGRFGQNRFAIQGKVDQKRIFNSILTSGEEEPGAANETRAHERAKALRQFQVAVETGVNRSPPLPVSDGDWNYGHAVRAHSPGNQRRRPLRA